MKNRVLILLLFLAIGNLMFAQNTEFGTWRTHLPFLNAKTLNINEDKIYCGTETGLFFVNKSDFSIERFTKNEGLTQNDIVAAGVHPSRDLIVLAYNNLNIDVLEGKKVTNVPAIKNSTILGVKEINEVVVLDDIAYICGSFGISVLDINNFVILETYSLTDGTSQVIVNDLALTQQNIYAATDNGIFIGQRDNAAQLFDFSNWQVQDTDYNLPPTSIDEIFISEENKKYVLSNGAIYQYLENQQEWQVFYENIDEWEVQSFTLDNQTLYASEYKIELNSNDDEVITEIRIAITNQTETEYFTTWNIQRPKDLLIDNNKLWFLDNWVGVSRRNGAEVNNFKPNGPRSFLNYALHIDANQELWVTAGTAPSDFGSAVGNPMGFYNFDGITWRNYDQWNLGEPGLLDLVTLTTNPQTNEVLIGSLFTGLYSFNKNNNAIVKYNNNNSGLDANSANHIKILGAAYDNENNLWISNADVDEPIKVLTADGNWLGFKPNIVGLPVTRFTEILVTSHNQIWFIIHRNGILVFDYGEDLQNKSDDRYKWLTNSSNSGDLPDNWPFALAEDKDGEIWVGTQQGIGIYFCAAQIFENECNAFQPLIEINGILGPLLDSDIITDIEVDNANRKWVATHNGVWLLSEDGETVIENFTSENSPLLGNEISDMAFNKNTGEIFFGTDKGINAFQSNSSEGKADFNEVYIYPNPVRPNYNGDITILNLMDESNVKITDLAGNLVHETTSLGGLVIWNGQDYTGRKVQSGVYLIFATSPDGFQSYEGKLLIVN